MVSTCAVFLSYPFETVSRRLMMTSGEIGKDKIYNGTMDCIKKIYKDEGGKAFYNGCLTSFFKGISGALTLMLYDSYKSLSLKYRQWIFSSKDRILKYISEF